MAARIWMLVPLIAVAWMRPAFAQEIANKPELRIGDTWMFHMTGNDDGKTVESAWRRVIVEKLPGDKIRVTPPYNVDVFDDSWNPIYRDRPDFWPVDYRFPLRVGASWSYASPVGASTVDGRSYDNHGNMKVVAYEPITVPAGTFNCFRIEGESYWSAAIDATLPDYVFTEKWRITNWYCPDVRFIGKSHTERYSGGNFRKGAYRTLDHELVGYRRGPATPVATASLDLAAADAPRQPSPFDGVWEGEQGIWRIKARVSGESIEGTIQCRNNDVWSGRTPPFAGIVAKDGSVDADSEALPRWAPRQIKGKLPILRIVGFGKLNCADGEVEMRKRE